MGNNKEYKKKWYEENKDRIKERYKIYYEKNKDKLKKYQKEYKKENPEIIKKRRKEYYENNKDVSLIKMKEYYEKNKDQINEYKKKWYEENKENIYLYQLKYRNENKDFIKQRYSNRINNDPVFALKISIRKNISKAFKRNGFGKNNKTEMIIGCSFDELKKYIESKFESWMNWENRGKYKRGVFNYGWDIDHIIPTSTAKTMEELIKLNHYTNLQPLCSHVNRDIKTDNI